jgi:signal transduction histidine kinase
MMVLKKVNEQLINYMWNDSSIICLIIDKDGIIQQANVFAETLTGKKLKNMLINEVFINFNRPLNINEYLIIPGKKIIINIDTASKLPSSYYFNFYDLGTSIMAIGEANNMEMESMGKAIIELNNELNNLTRELHKKNAELSKVNDLKNLFLGIAAHDLRNPLGHIKFYSDLLLNQLNDRISTDEISALENIKSSSEFLLHLVNELLDISAIESGKLTLDLKKTDIIGHIRQNVEANKILASKKNIEICFDSPVTVLEILMDKFKIEQVLNNLIGNAIKFSFPDTQIRVSIMLKDDQVILAVADQGQGIPEGEMDKIFKPFERTSVRSTAHERSTGLGLAIVYNIINMHMGKVWVESEVGKGSTFYFSLPVV